MPNPSRSRRFLTAEQKNDLWQRMLTGQISTVSRAASHETAGWVATVRVRERADRIRIPLTHRRSRVKLGPSHHDFCDLEVAHEGISRDPVHYDGSSPNH